MRPVTELPEHIMEGQVAAQDRKCPVCCQKAAQFPRRCLAFRAKLPFGQSLRAGALQMCPDKPLLSSARWTHLGLESPTNVIPALRRAIKFRCHDCDRGAAQENGSKANSSAASVNRIAQRSGRKKRGRSCGGVETGPSGGRLPRLGWGEVTKAARQSA